MRLTPLLQAAFGLQAAQLVDSAVPTTRAFWRTKYFNATEAEAHDPRPWHQVVADRKVTI